MSKGIVTEGLGVEGECKWVKLGEGYHEDDLGIYTRSGWVLVAIIQEDGVSISEGHYDQNMGRTVHTETPIHNTFFVLRRSTDETIKALSERLEEEKGRASSLASNAHEAEKAKTAAEKELANLEGEAEIQRDRVRRAESREKRYREESDKLRRQMAIVRRQVGELNLKDMLGEKFEDPDGTD